ncbi:hypothetical protein LTR56_008321 [Elasticomyces elasticus]|nr:hypothetical protein LTR56_008321 [Elasticomyces elasticus]KAK3661458.1 hypothetical protein LTR22_007467 [Elasticomyces elasticus]KAK4926185.1 hypothetical protein LTR49_006890 [Elasticomyces elasticus]KAK5750275.1 hypothetical protein LTS12_019692 [Elasticomyces elasticus]
MPTARDDPSLAYTIPFQLTKKIHRRVPDGLQPEKAENSQAGKIIVITGGGSGIGAASANVWVRAGAEGVVLVGRRKERLEQTARSLEALGKGTKILAIPADSTIEKDMLHVYSTVNKTFGRPADVVLANAGALSAIKPLGEEEASEWWRIYQVNVLGLHHTVACWIKTQPFPKNPVGTVINVSSGLEGLVSPGLSAYSTSKFAGHRYMEYLAAEYPSIRAFTLMPGIVPTDLADPQFLQYALDEGEQTGALALYLASPRGDYLKGSLTSINWDLDEMEARKSDIEQGLLKLKWVPVLPASGGSGI